MSVQVKQEPAEGSVADEKVFSRLQIQIDRLKEQIKSFCFIAHIIMQRYILQ